MATMTTAVDPAAAERRFYTGMAIAILAVVFVGFARSFFLRPWFPDHPAPPERFFTVHGLAFAAWIVLLVTQASFVRAGRVDLHRRLGMAGAGLALAMLVLGVWGALIAAKRSTGFVDIPVPPLQFLIVPFADLLLFATFVAYAIARRGDPQTHKRAMLLATISILGAAVARLPGLAALGPPAFFGLTDLFIVAIGVWDWRTRGRLHPLTLWGGLALIVSQPLRLAVMGTEGWLAFARWATGLIG